MATRKNTDRFALSASGMTNIRTMPLRKQRQEETAQRQAKPRNARNGKNGR